MTTSELVVAWGAIVASGVWANSPTPSLRTWFVATAFILIAVVQVVAAVVR